MKLDLASTSAATQISQKTTDAATSTQDKTSAVPPSSTDDRTTFSSGASGVRALVSDALATPPIRQDKVDSVRQSMSDGTYKFDAGKVADAMIASSNDS